MPKDGNICDIKTYFEEHGLKGKKCRIYDFNSAFYIGDYIKLMKKKASLARDYSKFETDNNKVLQQKKANENPKIEINDFKLDLKQVVGDPKFSNASNQDKENNIR